MSILIKELEARKDDYILVADVINLMADATGDTPFQVIEYLVGFDIDDNLMMFDMDEYYKFYQSNSCLVSLGSDANITYFKKADVMAFEPITKHGIFNDKPATLVNDIYGRTYDINQYKKNREDEYLTLAETLNLLNYNADINSPSYDHVKLRDLARKRLITPCFYFCGYVGSFGGDSSKVLKTEIMTGYFSYRLLVEEIYNYDDYMKLPNNGVMIYRVLEKQTAEYVDYDDVFLFYDKPQGLDEAEKFKLTHMESEEIRFSKQELSSYIESVTPVSASNEPTAQDSELRTKLETTQAENNALNVRVSTAINTYRQNQNEIKELKAQLEKSDADYADLKEKLSIADAALAAAQSTVEQPQGFDKYNARRGSFITTGKAVARYLWSIDTTQAIRTGDMVQQLITIMHDIDASLLPDEAAIRVWLSDVAPDYAKKAGKTPNNAPKIIPLDMKR